MEFFLPSILFLLVACGIVFFVIPRFGPLILASVALLLLILGVYNHYSMFQSEYKLSTWQMGAAANAPYIMIGALVLGIVLYLLYLVPSGESNVPSNVKMNLPPANTATNAVTEGINNAMRKTADMFKVKVNGENGGKGNEGAFGNNNSNNNNNANRNNRGNNRGPNNRPGIF